MGYGGSIIKFDILGDILVDERLDDVSEYIADYETKFLHVTYFTLHVGNINNFSGDALYVS